jgi:hypothetical protein
VPVDSGDYADRRRESGIECFPEEVPDKPVVGISDESRTRSANSGANPKWNTRVPMTSRPVDGAEVSGISTEAAHENAQRH